MQLRQRSAGRPRMRNVGERCPRQRIAVEVASRADPLHFVHPIGVRQRSAALRVVQYLHHRRAGPAQMGHEAVFLAQRGHAAHTAVVAFDDDRATCRVHACRCRERARAMPAHRSEVAHRRKPLQHAMDFIGGQYWPVRQCQFQAHAMHLVRDVHGPTPDRRSNRAARVIGIDQVVRSTAEGAARAPSRTRTALPGRCRIASAIRSRRCRQ